MPNNQVIKTKGGTEATIPNGYPRELMITTDTSNLYVGKGTTLPPVLVADSTVPSRVQALENQANTIFISNGDDFNDYSLVDTSSSTSVLVENGYIRPSIFAYAQNFATDEAYNELLSTSNIVVENGNAFQNSGTVGVTETNGTDVPIVESLVSKKFTFSGTSMNINVTPTFTTPTPLLAHSSLRFVRGSGDIAMNDAGITKVFKDSSDNTYYVFLNWSSTNIYFTVYKNGFDSSDLILSNSFSSTYTILSDTHIKTIGFTESSSNLFFAIPTSTSDYRIYRVDKTTNVNTSTTVISNGVNLCQGIDIFHDGTRLHVLFATSDSTNRDVKYVSFTSTFPSTYNTTTDPYLVRYTGASEYVYKVKLVSLGGQRVAWSSFCRRSSGAVAFGVIDHTVNASFPHNYRTDAANTATAPLWATGTRLFNNTGYLSDSNGCGTMVFDNTNNFCYLVWGSNGNSDTGFGRIATNSPTALPVSNLITVSPFDYFAPRDCQAFLRPSPTTNGQRVLEVFFHRSALSINAATRTNLIRANVSISSAGVFSYSGNTADRNTLLENTSFFLLNSISLIPLSSTENHYDIYTTHDEFSLSYIRHANLTPELQVRLTNLNGANLSGGIVPGFATSGTPISFNLTGVTNGELLISFRFIYHILTEDFTGTNRSVSLSSFTIEQTGVSSPPTSTFISKPLITDRIVRTVTLDVTEDIGGVGNSITWEVASLGDIWLPINASTTPAWTVEFPENQYGSQLRVKATMVKDAGNNTIATVPKIQKYVANVKNILTASDLLPIQVNMLKMALKINTLGTFTTTDFQKMMVDIFENESNIDTTNTTATLSAGTYTATGSSKVVMSLPETTTGDGVSVITSAIVMAEYSGTVSFYVRRGNGSWGSSIQLGEVIQFLSGTPSNQIQIKAEMQPGSTLYGWAYLYQ
jgi:hypothetical protein